MFSDLWIVLFLVLTVIGLVAGQPFVLALGVLGFLVGGVARVWSRLSLEEVEYVRKLPPEPMVVGDEFEMELVVTNRKPIPMPWLRIADTIPIGLDVFTARTDMSLDRASLILKESTNLAWYERVRIRHRVRALRRGYHQLGPVSLTSGDMFGMFVTKSEDQRHDAVVVYPQTVDLPDVDFPMARPVGEARTRVPLWEDPSRLRGLREYRPGDPLKTVDWKVTARLREVFVRTFEPTVSQYAMVVVDVTTTDHLYEGYSPVLLERAVVGGASMACRAQELGYRFGLLSNGIPLTSGSRMVIPPGAGPAHLGRVMEALSMLRPIASDRLAGVLRRESASVPFGCTLIVVSAVMSEALVSMLDGLAAHGHPIAAIYVGEGPVPSGTRRVRISDMAERFNLPIPEPARPSGDDGEVFEADLQDDARGGRSEEDTEAALYGRPPAGSGVR